MDLINSRIFTMHILMMNGLGEESSLHLLHVQVEVSIQACAMTEVGVNMMQQTSMEVTFH